MRTGFDVRATALGRSAVSRSFSKVRTPVTGWLRVNSCRRWTQFRTSPEFVGTYEPDWVLAAQPSSFFDGYRQSTFGILGLLERERPRDLGIHPELALLLTVEVAVNTDALSMVGVS